MTDISLWVSIFGLFGSLISIIRLYFTSASPPAGQESPPAVTPKCKEDDRYIVMGINFGVIHAAEFDNAIRFYFRRPARRPGATRRPPSHQSSKKMTNISLRVSILGLFGPMNSIMLLDFTSAAPDDRYILMGIYFGVIWAADFDDDIRFTVGRPVHRSRVTRRPRHIKILKNMTDIL